MAVLSLQSLNPFRWRVSQHNGLPLYRRIVSPTTPKEAYSESTTLSDVDEDDYSDGDVSNVSSTMSPSPRNSAKSPSAASSAYMHRKRHIMPPKHRGQFFYRLPNKVIRYLCLGMIATLVLFILSLVRASVVENRKVANGDVEKAPEPPPLWESFPFLTRYFGGIRSVVPFDQSSPQYPRLQDEQPFNISSPSTFAKGDAIPSHGRIAKGAVPQSQAFVLAPPSDNALPLDPCYVDSEDTVSVPAARYIEGRPLGLPLHVIGSYDLLSIREDICVEKYGRYGPYGYGYSIRSGGLGLGEHGENEGSQEVWQTTPQVDFRNVDWAAVQQRCYKRNAARYQELPARHTLCHGFYIGEEGTMGGFVDRRAESAGGQAAAAAAANTTNAQAAQQSNPRRLARTAVVVRGWDEFEWHEEDILNFRALISELSLASGGQYDVHLLVQIKNDARHPIFADDATYQKRIEETVPAEFRSLVTLWTETQMLSVYQGIHDLYTRGPGLPVHGSYRGLQMAMQLFAHQHPEYEQFWQWEMDIRYTGHYLDLFTKMTNWARDQPRKGLWERNARFYIPSVHGSWDDFKQMARVQSELGTGGTEAPWDKVPGATKEVPGGARGERTVWGPLRPEDENDWFEPENDPQPPTSYERDKYSWGVGEEADLITLNPLFDPAGTTWLLADDITGYNESDGKGKPPRRAQIITASRMSGRLLRAMHYETAFKKHHAFPEMWPGTVALQHGYKAVYVPHPVYVDREWPTQYMAQVYNGGKSGASGGSRNSVFGGREHNLRGITWFYNSGFSGNLYRRWMGLRVNNDGGEEFELEADETKDDSNVNQMRGGEGRMCLPPMLLHPVKSVKLPVELEEDGSELPDSDPAA
jgi:hypothetical protein